MTAGASNLDRCRRRAIAGLHPGTSSHARNCGIRSTPCRSLACKFHKRCHWAAHWHLDPGRLSVALSLTPGATPTLVQTESLAQLKSGPNSTFLSGAVLQSNRTWMARGHPSGSPILAPFLNLSGGSVADFRERAEILKVGRETVRFKGVERTFMEVRHHQITPLVCRSSKNIVSRKNH